MASLPALAVPTMSTISPTVPNTQITTKGVSSSPHPSPLTARRAPTSNVAAPSSTRIGSKTSPASARGFVVESERQACCAGLFEVSSTFTTTAPKISRRTEYSTEIAAAARMPLDTSRLGLETRLTFTQVIVRQSHLPAGIGRSTPQRDGLRRRASRWYRAGGLHRGMSRPLSTFSSCRSTWTCPSSRPSWNRPSWLPSWRPFLSPRPWRRPSSRPSSCPALPRESRRLPRPQPPRWRLPCVQTGRRLIGHDRPWLPVSSCVAAPICALVAAPARAIAGDRYLIVTTYSHRVPFEPSISTRHALRTRSRPHTFGARHRCLHGKLPL